MSNSLRRRKTLADILVDLGFASPEIINDIHNKAYKEGKPFERVLLSEGFVSEEQLAEALATKAGVPYVSLDNEIINPEIFKVVSLDQLEGSNFWVSSINSSEVTVVVSDPSDIILIERIREVFNRPIKIKVSSSTQIQALVNRAKEQSRLGQGENLNRSSGFSQRGHASSSDKGEKSTEDLTEVVDRLIVEAISQKASDIHIEPDEGLLRVRIRVDGILHELKTFKLDMHSSIISRLKIMSNLDIAERRNSQDGSFRHSMNGKIVDVRISTLPTVLGERAVLRILDRSSMKVEMDEVGFDQNLKDDVSRVIQSPHGIILVTGPTGSGKTTTVYAMLNEINSIEANVITIEDPVEYRFELMNQIQVNPHAGLTFPKILKSVLRQDPDIIMVGEIRDVETAELAVEASLTGHLVISTLHTNSAMGAVVRLLEMGIEPYLLSSSLVAVVAQRLVRTLCTQCKVERGVTDSELEVLSSLGDPRVDRKMKVFEPVGCKSCFGTGYSGRQPIFEFLEITKDMRVAINEDPRGGRLGLVVEKTDFRSMRSNGLIKVLDGVTTVSEVVHSTT